MSVYVDGLQKAHWKYGMTCHLIADSLDELKRFGRRLKLKVKWISWSPRYGVPYYLCAARRREEAIAKGAMDGSKNKEQLQECVRKWTKVKNVGWEIV